MTHTPADALVRRIERLERENRRLKRAGAAIVLGILAVLLMGQAVPKGPTIEAQRFVLKDKRGKVRAVLGEGADGETGLFVYDGKQRPRAMVAMLEHDAPVIQLADDRGVPRVALDPTGGLAITGDGPRVLLGVTYGTEPMLQLIDKEGWTRASLALATGPSPAPILKFLDPRGNARMWLGAMSDGRAQLLMMGRPPQRQPGPTVDLSRATIPGTATLEVDADGAGSLQFRRGGTMWKAP